MKYLAGVDIGGTKCAVCLGRLKEGGIDILGKKRFPTPPTPQAALQAMQDALAELLQEHPGGQLQAVGVSCGNPMDSRKGLVLLPPNLPGWDRIDVVTPFQERFKVPAALQNDANACALAEWRWGAGRGYQNLIFLTFGTGMGAGLILDGRLYSGTNDNAGEVGHIRLEKEGAVGYGKRGSFEGFCSGGGIAQMARTLALEKLQVGIVPSFCPNIDALPAITTEMVGKAAQNGDPLAIEVFHTIGTYLGRALALLVDILNPELIILGSIYFRQEAVLEDVILRAMRAEALPQAAAVCKIVPAGLGEQLGDYAALSVAMGKM